MKDITFEILSFSPWFNTEDYQDCLDNTQFQFDTEILMLVED